MRSGPIHFYAANWTHSSSNIMRAARRLPSVFWRLNVRLVVVLLNSNLTITRNFFSHLCVVLCDATNETLEYICCVVTTRQYYVSTVSIKYSMRTRGDPRRKQSQANLLTVDNLLHENISSSSRTLSFPGHPFEPRSFLFHP
jgi:hypothetical protein